jgi:hypothetical protein
MKTIQECQEAEEMLRGAEDNFLECLGFKKLSLVGQIDKWEPPNASCQVVPGWPLGLICEIPVFLTRSEAILNARMLLQQTYNR